jgi:hypothetical protein
MVLSQVGSRSGWRRSRVHLEMADLDAGLGLPQYGFGEAEPLLGLFQFVEGHHISLPQTMEKIPQCPLSPEKTQRTEAGFLPGLMRRWGSAASR